MRTYGRITNQDGSKTWQVVTTDQNGYNDQVYLVTLGQALLLFLEESPFFADVGIPARESVLQQVFPDFYVARTQQQFSQYFSALLVSKLPTSDPEYNISVTFKNGAVLAFQNDGTQVPT